MARSVFFSFDYDRDIWRVSQIRNHYITKDGISESGYIDKASWESVKKQKSENIKKWIDRNLDGTSVTVVLIGNQSYYSEWIKYEIIQSLNRGNGLFGVYIHNLENENNETDAMGLNPIERVIYKNKG